MGAIVLAILNASGSVIWVTTAASSWLMAAMASPTSNRVASAVFRPRCTTIETSKRRRTVSVARSRRLCVKHQNKPSTKHQQKSTKTEPLYNAIDAPSYTTSSTNMCFMCFMCIVCLMQHRSLTLVAHAHRSVVQRGVVGVHHQLQQPTSGVGVRAVT